MLAAFVAHKLRKHTNMTITRLSTYVGLQSGGAVNQKKTKVKCPTILKTREGLRVQAVDTDAT